MSPQDNTVVLAPVTMNDDLKSAVNKAVDSADIRAAVIAEAQKQSDAAAPTAPVAAAAAAAPAATPDTPFTRTENIGGRDFVFEADTELELERMVNNAFKVAYAVREETPAAPAVDPAVAAAEAERIAADRAAEKVELELKFKRGDITAAQYIEQSGAIEDYLEAKGVPLSELKDSLDNSRNNTEVQSWQQATDAFLNGPAGSDWPGGQKNLKIIGLKIQELGLVDAPDKVAALAQAWTSMKESEVFFPFEAPAAVAPAAPAAPAAAPAAVAPVVAPATPAAPAAPARTPASSSAIFGASSGAGGEGVSALAPKGDVKIDPNASPAEILAQWKAANVAAGKNPNDAFMETFSARRV